VLDQALGLLEHHFRDLHVPACGLVEGRGDYLALYRALHVGHLFRAFVDKQDDQVYLRMVGGNGVRYFLEQYGFTGAGRRDDQGALSFADRGHQVYDPHVHVLARGLQADALLGIQRRQVVKQDPVLELFRVLEVHGLDPEERVKPLVVLRGAYLAGNGIAGLKAEQPDLRRGHIDVVRAGQVVVVGRAEEPVPVGKNLENAAGEDEALLLGLRLEDLEDQVLFLQAVDALDPHLLGYVDEIGDLLGFQLPKVKPGPGVRFPVCCGRRRFRRGGRFRDRRLGSVYDLVVGLVRGLC